MEINGDIVKDGPFFGPEFARAVRHNANAAIKRLAEEGRELVKQELAQARDTGFTIDAIEAKTYPWNPPNGVVGNVYWKVHMKGDLSRGGSGKYPASRVPYIVERVLETGHYGGTRGGKVTFYRGSGKMRQRSYWKAGRTVQRGRVALHQFGRAYRKLMSMVRMGDLTRGVE